MVILLGHGRYLLVRTVDSNDENVPGYQTSGHLFSRFARWLERGVGRPGTLVAAIVIVLIWGATGPIFHWSDTWQLIINTGTTIVTFLMVFVLQNTQTRDTQAMQIKLDELIRANDRAHNTMISIEELSEAELAHLKEAIAARSLRDSG